MEANEELAWAAGYLAAQGSMSIVSSGSRSSTTKVVRLTIRVVSRIEAHRQFAEILKLDSKWTLGKQVESRDKYVISVQGVALKAMLTKLWPYLNRERKEEYAKLVRQIRADEERAAQKRAIRQGLRREGRADA